MKDTPHVVVGLDCGRPTGEVYGPFPSELAAMTFSYTLGEDARTCPLIAPRTPLVRYFNEEVHLHLVHRAALYERRTLDDGQGAETFDTYLLDGDLLYVNASGHVIVWENTYFRPKSVDSPVDTV